MAVQVSQIQRPQKVETRKGNDTIGKILTIGGAIVGGATGGFQGAMAGANAGQMVAGVTGLDKPDTKEVISQPEPPRIETGGSDAMQRRIQKINESNLSQLRNSINSLQYIEDPNERMAIAKPLLKAQYLAERES